MFLSDHHPTLFSKNEDVAEQFEIFYSKLYNRMSDNPDPNTLESRTTQIRDFLAQHCPKTITTQQAEDLKSPLSV